MYMNSLMHMYMNSLMYMYMNSFMVLKQESWGPLLLIPGCLLVPQVLGGQVVLEIELWVSGNQGSLSPGPSL